MKQNVITTVLAYVILGLLTIGFARAASGPTGETATLFFDDFSAPLDPNIWDYNHFSAVNNPSFYGRTQQRQTLPSVSNGVLHLQLDTFNPTNLPPPAPPTFYGSEAITKQTFAPSNGAGIAFEVSARIVTPVAGIVGGLFGYNFNSATGLHSELDTELLGNEVAAGRNRAETNVYSNEPSNAGHPQFVPAIDLTQFHIYRMEWFPDRVRWLIDNYVVREDTVHIPQGALALHLNIWAPTADFADAYSASLQPTSNAASNVSYFADVDYVRVARLGIYTPVFCCKDFNGDGKADVLWRNSDSGDVYEWLLNGVSAIGQGSLGVVGNDWQIAGIGDFNGDGKADVLWRNNNTGEVYVWLTSGLGVIAQGSLGIIGSDWQIAGVGDFNGDGKADILWRNSSGEVFLWLMDGISTIAQGSLGIIGSDWHIVAVGDLNGDGKADILWRNASGEVYLWLMNAIGVSGPGSLGVVGNDWQIINVGDFNGDGRADILWRNASGEVYVWLMNGLSAVGQGSLGVVGNDWQIAGVGDLNGDGKADILWRNNSGQVYEWLLNGLNAIGQGSLGVVGNDWYIE
jgi:beta-glucanase (GH16 family)